MHTQTPDKKQPSKRARLSAHARAVHTAVIAQKHTVLAAAILVSAAVLWPCGNAFWTRVAVGGRVVSGVLSDDRLEHVIAGQAAGYELRLRYPNGREQAYPLRALGLSVDAHTSVAALHRAQDTPLHWLTWWRAVPVTLATRVDTATFQAFVKDHAVIVIQPAKNAALKLEDGRVVITPGTTGRQYGFTNPTRSLLRAARSLQPQPLQLTTVVREPAISEHTLQEPKAQLEHILHQRLTIAIGDTTLTPDAAHIASWLTLTPTGTTVAIGINRDELRGYLNTVAEAQTKDPRSRVVSDTTGAELVKGENGARVTNTVDITDGLVDSIVQAKAPKLSMAVATTPFKTISAPTAGKWIEVDVTTKRMYAYDNGEVVRTFLVSAGAWATPTVIGRYNIYAKYRSQDMFGTNADGSRYFQPAVPYVNYFYHDYAIHGNYWRPASYFGNINSSHGCVGVTVNEGAWIYSWAPVGTPVVIHT